MSLGKFLWKIPRVRQLIVAWLLEAIIKYLEKWLSEKFKDSAKEKAERIRKQVEAADHETERIIKESRRPD